MGGRAGLAEIPAEVSDNNGCYTIHFDESYSNLYVGESILVRVSVRNVDIPWSSSENFIVRF